MRRAGAALLVLALATLGAAGWLAAEPVRLAWSGQRVEGRAAGVLREPFGPFVRLRPIIAYRIGGAERRVLGSGLVAYPAGVTVPVLQAGERAGLPGLFEGWAGPASLGLLALLLGGPGAWFWMRAPRRDRRIDFSTAEMEARRARGEAAMGKRQKVLRSRR
ncbi:hypothetical protein [Falsiroseomonas sp. HW251]|uniref:hypothetical protein n=1 Tax=Falsiroseomonas sp. HW251 TaxID=3390998 RepID=UPI003D310A3E